MSAWDGHPRLAPRDRSPEDAETSGAHLQQSLSSPIPPSPPALAARDPASHPNCTAVTRGASHNLCTTRGRQNAKPLLTKAASPRHPPPPTATAFLKEQFLLSCRGNRSRVALCRQLEISSDGSGLAEISLPFPLAALIFPPVTSSPHLDQTISAPLPSLVPQRKGDMPCATSLVSSLPSLWLLLSPSLLLPQDLNYPNSS